MDTNNRVVIMGAGALGKAVGGLIAKNGAVSEYWDANPAAVPDQKPLAELVPGARHILLCVPSWAMREAVHSILSYLPPETTLFSFAKGIEKDSLQTMAEMIPTLIPPTQPFVVVGGPMLAQEIVAGKKAIGIFASHNEAALASARELFANESFAVETTSDAVGVALASVLKNIYAVALGIADGLDLSGNEKGWLAGRALGEMQGIATIMGVDPKVMIGAAGAGDLIATGYSTSSRNRTVGMEIVKNGVCNLRGEGLNAIPFLIRRLEEKVASFPLLMLINTIGIECKPAAPVFESFFRG
jgi:glycerol-3-phosphate dehydrogenase (NAD(P)+)